MTISPARMERIWTAEPKLRPTVETGTEHYREKQVLIYATVDCCDAWWWHVVGSRIPEDCSHVVWEQAAAALIRDKCSEWIVGHKDEYYIGRGCVYEHFEHDGLCPIVEHEDQTECLLLAVEKVLKLPPWTDPDG